MTFSLPPSARCLSPLSMAAALVFGTPALGQQPATTDAAVAIPAMSCSKPSDFTPTFKSAQELARFNKSLDVYKTCVSDYVHANSTKANDLAAQARAYNDSANAAITDFNAYMTELNVASKAAGEKTPAMQGGAPKMTP